MDTLTELHQQQIARELEIQQENKTAAARVIRAHGKANRWPKGDIAQVIDMLGLGEPARVPPGRLTNFNSKVN